MTDTLTDSERETVERLRRDRLAMSPADLRSLAVGMVSTVDRLAPRPTPPPPRRRWLHRFCP